MYKIKNALALNEVGKRVNNEDAVYPILPKDERMSALAQETPQIPGLYLVCDGVGGANKGEIASMLVSVNIPDYIKNNAPGSDPLAPEYINHAIKKCEKAMDSFSASFPESSGMATTLTLAYFNDFGVSLAWAGDSRIYHIRNGKICYKTTDHSLVNELVKMGQITPEQALTHPRKNVILRAVMGSHNPIQAECHYILWDDIQAGDWFFLCSDGILEGIKETDFEGLFLQEMSAQAIIDKISDKCYYDSRDNYSCYLIQMGEKEGLPIHTPITSAADIPVIASTTVLQPETPVVETPIIEKTEIIQPPVIEASETEIPEVSAPSIDPPIVAVPEIEPQEVAVPAIETPIAPPTPQVETTTLLSQEKPTTLLESLQQQAQSPATPPVTETPVVAAAPSAQLPPKKGVPWVAIAIAAFFIFAVMGTLWYFMDGPGSKNTLFEDYYAKAQSALPPCLEHGKCETAKGIAGQAKTAAETREEHKLADDILAKIKKKEDEIRAQKEQKVINAPTTLDQGKADPNPSGLPKSKTDAPASPTNGKPNNPEKEVIGKGTETPAKTTTTAKTTTSAKNTTATTSATNGTTTAATSTKTTAKPTVKPTTASTKPTTGGGISIVKPKTTSNPADSGK